MAKKLKKFKTSINVSVVYDAKDEDDAYNQFMDDLVNQGEVGNEIEVEEVKPHKKKKLRSMV